jgi:hypothetical protein
MLRRYQRVTFEKELIAVEGRPLAEYVTSGHPLLCRFSHRAPQAHR